MESKAKGEELLPRLAPIPRKVVPGPASKSVFARGLDKVLSALVPGFDDAQGTNRPQRRRGAFALPILELLGIATLIFLLAK